jgi:hypothetical protein
VEQVKQVTPLETLYSVLGVGVGAAILVAWLLRWMKLAEGFSRQPRQFFPAAVAGVLSTALWYRLYMVLAAEEVQSLLPRIAELLRHD